MFGPRHLTDAVTLRVDARAWAADIGDLTKPTLRLEGALGPMQAFGTAGHLTVRLAPAGPSTEVTRVYDIGGHSVCEKSGLAPVVDPVLAEQVARLKTAVGSDATPWALCMTSGICPTKSRSGRSVSTLVRGRSQS